MRGWGGGERDDGGTVCSGERLESRMIPVQGAETMSMNASGREMEGGLGIAGGPGQAEQRRERHARIADLDAATIHFLK